MNKKIIIILILLILVLFISEVTYSIFRSSASLTSSNQSIAKFAFNSEILDTVQLDINNINPGDSKVFSFSVTNSLNEKVSDVTIEYQISISTYHLMPLNIELYKKENDNYILVSSCDETYSRNIDNELVCNMPIDILNNLQSKINYYELRVSFPIEYNDYIYSNLVDYIKIGLKSWQKI